MVISEKTDINSGEKPFFDAKMRKRGYNLGEIPPEKHKFKRKGV